MANKFGADDWFDVDATVKDLKKAIVQRCREHGEVCLEARESFEAIEAAESDYSGSRDLFGHSLMHSKWTDFWGEYWLDQLDICTTIEPSFRCFWEGPWQSFIDVLKQEVHDHPTPLSIQSGENI